MSGQRRRRAYILYIANIRVFFYSNIVHGRDLSLSYLLYLILISCIIHLIAYLDRYPRASYTVCIFLPERKKKKKRKNAKLRHRILRIDTDRYLTSYMVCGVFNYRHVNFSFFFLFFSSFEISDIFLYIV